MDKTRLGHSKGYRLRFLEFFKNPHYKYQPEDIQALLERKDVWPTLFQRDT